MADLHSGVGNMTTLIDDGLVESCLDDPISVIDLDRENFIDVDNIDAVIEDPGYILDDVPKTLNRDEEYSSSYKKRSCALPVAFFDISRNIRLLKKCRPIVIKIVDCGIYPWYYKKKKPIKIESNITNVDEDSNLYKLSHCKNDISKSTCYDTGVRNTVSSTPSPGINLSPEQRAMVLKLKEEIDNEVHGNNIKKIADDLYKVNLKSHENTPVSNNSTFECQKSIERHDLLTYKEIAQTIVRNIESDKKTVTSKFRSVNNDTEKLETNKIERKKTSRENIPTSPILPYSVKRQKKIKPKEKITEKVSTINNVLEKCSKSNKECDKYLSSVNHVIPHYHCKLSKPGNNNSGLVTNHQNVQESMTNDWSLYRHQPHTISGYNSIPVVNSRRRLVSSTSNLEQMYYHDFSAQYNSFGVNNAFVTMDHFTENINPNFHTYVSHHHLYYPSLLNYNNDFYSVPQYFRQPKVKKINDLRLVRRPSAMQKPKDNLHTFSSSKDLYSNCMPNTMCLLNDNVVDYSTPQISMQRTAGNIVQCNPLLTEFLNRNNQNEYCQPVMQQYGGLGYEPVGCAPYPVVEQDIWWHLRPPPPPPLPPPPPPPPPNEPFDGNLTSPQFSQEKNVQSPTQGLPQCFSIEDANLAQPKGNSNMKQSEITIMDHKSTPIDSSKVHLTTEIDSKDDHNNMSEHAVNMNQISQQTCRLPDPKLLIDKNIEVNHNNVVNILTEPPKTLDVNILGKVDSKEIGYSPPILPIPTFKKSLEMLSELNQEPIKRGIYNNANTTKTPDMNEQTKINAEIRDMVRKRRLNDDEKIYISNKRISLHEYKQRRSDNLIAII